jgi:hypothetical protein
MHNIKTNSDRTLLSINCSTYSVPQSTPLPASYSNLTLKKYMKTVFIGIEANSTKIWTVNSSFLQSVPRRKAVHTRHTRFFIFGGALIRQIKFQLPAALNDEVCLESF